MTFDKPDLFRQAGYSEGDVVPIWSIGTSAIRSQSTTSTSYATIRDLWNAKVRTDQLVPDTDRLQALLTLQVNPGTNETAAVRIRNDGASQTVAEITGVTANQAVSSGFVDYDPTNPSSIEDWAIQIKTDPGSASSGFFAPTLVLGVQL